MEDLIQTITDLKQRRAKVIADQKEILRKAREEGRSLFTPEENEAYAKAEKDYEPIDKQLRQLEELQSKEQRTALEMSTWTTNTTAPVKPEDEYRNTFWKYVRTGLSSLSGEEKAVMQRNFWADSEKRAQTVTTTGGGYAIPQGFAGRVEEFMKWYGPMNDGNVVEFLNTASGNPLPYPTLNDTSNTGRLLAINTQVTTTDVTFGQVTFGAYKFSSDQLLVPVELLEDEAVNLEGVLANQLGARLGRVINTYLTTGTGSSEPKGVVTCSTLGKTATATTAFTRDEIIDLIHSVDKAYRTGPKAGFLFHDLILAEIKKQTIGSGDDRPLWQPSIREGEPDKLEGFPYWVNNDMASTVVASAKVMLFGDFSKFVVRNAGSLRLLRLAERLADYDQVCYFGLKRVDSNVIASGAFKHMIMAA